ncbi:hypothetical protein KAU45_07875 [bacterium]|nr:hypothetical protein [bacterium]
MKRYHIHGAIALLSLTTLVYELSLMRVFSVTAWYYFAFFVISLALLGFGAAAALIFVFRDFFRRHLSSLIPGAALLFGLFAAVNPLIYLNLDLRLVLDSTGLINIAITLLLFFLPFFFGGIVIAGIFSVYSERIGTLYWADLTGASLGCILVIPLLYLTPAPNLLSWAGALPIIAAFLLNRGMCDENGGGADRKIKGKFIIPAALASVLVIALALSGFFPFNPYKVRFSKVIHKTEKPIHTSWNAFSRLTIYDNIFFQNEKEVEKPFGWGMSPIFSGSDIKQYWIDQDDCAGTPITNFDGDFKKLDFLGYDVTNIAYQYRGYDNVLIVGSGGGRDILAAKYFGVQSVTAVEINPAMIETVEEIFGDFSGHPYKLPGVKPAIDEARNFIARDSNRYDLIMISLIDSWAASMAGAFTLAENNLYTVEAFELYLNHLRQDGVLTVSRWYHGSRRAEALRLVNLCAVTLERMGVGDPGRHIAVIQGDRIATVITSKSPFTEKELDEIQNAVDRLRFNAIWVPGQVGVDEGINALLSSKDRNSYVASLPIDIRAPVDDRPFFFLFHSSILEPPPKEIPGKLTFSIGATTTLKYLFYILLFACLIFIILPLALRKKGGYSLINVLIRPHKWLYFAGIGLGFMLVELSLIQRYMLFLGHPSYATSVVIFSLLLFAGLGSATTNRLKKRYPLRGLNLIVFSAIGLGILIQAFIAPWLLAKAMAAHLIWRFLITGLMLAPLGFVMGMAFPIGISRLNEAESGGMIPYVWGINSVMSVLATVMATVIAVAVGYTIGLMTGLAAYALAALTCAFKWRKKLIAEKS